MKNFKKLMTLVLAMLALTACEDSKEEPIPEPNVKETTLYLATGFAGYPEFILNLDGDTVYMCEDEESRIHSLVAEDYDWYAVIRKGDGLFNVLKNGNSIHVTGENIRGFTVENGNIYTVQENEMSGKIWLCKDFKRIYEIPNTTYYNTFSVDHGSVVMGVYDEKPCYWCNGEIITIEGLEGGFDWVYGIDKKGDDLLITYQDIPTGKNMYWWKGAVHEFSSNFAPSGSRIINGHAYIWGETATNQTVGGVERVPAVYIDGVETILSDSRGYRVAGLVVDDADTYFLVKHSSGAQSYIYKNLEAITLPDVEIPDFYKPYYGDKCSLGKIGIKCFAVVRKQ